MAYSQAPGEGTNVLLENLCAMCLESMCCDTTSIEAEVPTIQL